MLVVPLDWWTRHGPEVFLENVRNILPAQGRVLDYGAGRGKYRGQDRMERLIDFRAPGREAVGFDLDPAIRDNPFLDRAEVGDGAAPLPFADASFDTIVSLAVFEHVANAEHTARELARVLKPGGWICAVTPHSASYVAIASRIVPNSAHKAVLGQLDIKRGGEDVFPTHYRMNTLAALDRLFPGFDDHSYVYSGIPSYTRGNPALAAIFKAWDRAVAGRTIQMFKQKK
jgi:SAM-dependent methyltransferase